MKKIFFLNFFALSFILVNSCSHEKPREQVKEVILINPTEAIKLNRSRLFQLEGSYQLTLPSTYTFSEVGGMEYCQGDILVSMGSVVLFDHQGNFIRKIGNRGRGQGETLSVVALSCNNDLITLLDRTQQKIVQYTTWGEFVKEVSVGLFGQRGIAFQDHYFLYTGNEPNEAGKRITLLDNDFLIADHAYDLEDGFEYMNMFDKTNFFQYRDSLRFLNAFDNNIYNVSAHDGVMDFSTRYSIDFGSHNIPESFYMQDFNNIMEYSMALSQTQYANRILGYIETDELVLFSFWFNNQILLAAYSKLNNRTTVIEEFYDDLVFAGLSFAPVDEWFDYHFMNGKIHWTIDPILFKEKLDEARSTMTDAQWQSFQNTNEELINLYRDLDLHAGPVVLVMGVSDGLVEEKQE